MWFLKRPPLVLLPPFPSCQVLRLWEALWAGVPGLHLYLCVAALEHHRREVLRCVWDDFVWVLLLWTALIT